MEKIIYVVDKKSSALYTAASSRIALTGGKILIANEFISPRHLLKSIYKEGGGIVLFCWRKVLGDIISLNRSLKIYKEFNDDFTFAFLVPDHMGLETKFGNIEAKLIDASEYYVVTSKLLFDQYTAKYPTKPPKLIYHDLPNIKLIEEVRKCFQKNTSQKTKIIWVGNSKWGRHQGYKDHKGLKKYVIPLKEHCEKYLNNLAVEIIDSSVHSLDQQDTLRRIRESDILIQVSKSEGTGLVILEAFGLETDVLTTNVGIAGEFFPKDDYRIINDKSIQGLINSLENLVSNTSMKNKRKGYEDYIDRAKSENLVTVTKSRKIIEQTSMFLRIKIYVYWFYRFICNKWASNSDSK
jgi:hypothetical protein